MKIRVEFESDSKEKSATDDSDDYEGKDDEESKTFIDCKHAEV